MTTDDFLLDQLERDQQQQTRRRRENRSRRRQLYLLGTVTLVVLLVLGAPSLVSHSSLGRSLLIQTLSQYQLDATVESIRIGWVTPLRVDGLRLRGASGSEIAVDQLDVDVTVGDWVRSRTHDLGEVAVRGLTIRCEVDRGRCNLEDDLQPWLQPSDEPSTVSAQIKLQDVRLSVTDVVSSGTWEVSQSSGEAIIAPGSFESTFAGVLTEPGGGGGSLQAAIVTSPQAKVLASSETSPPSRWRLELASESLPLSVATLVRRRVTEIAPYVPETIHGDATGALLVRAMGDDTVEVAVNDLRVRNLTASGEGSRVWSNGLATINGGLTLKGDRVIGRQLRAATDFASATIDGAFSRNFSLVGANDNPLRWLDAIDGTATAEIDLAAFDRSLPGVLPLRDDATLLSGRIVAKVDSTPSGPNRRSQFRIETDAMRARSKGQAVMIDPIKLSASVSNDGGQLRAEQFEWNSAFGSAVGHGDLRSGVADFEIDFGRLTAMLRPILQVSETTLAGAANGNIQWNASADSTWRLSGSADGNNLLITFPSGQSLRRQSLRGVIDAVGRWGGQSLSELSSAKLSLVSSGLDLQAELTHPVREPSAEIPIPVQLRGTGRLETLRETIGPWLPRELADLTGGFQFTAQSEIARNRSRLTQASLLLTEPSMHYAGRHISQSKMEVKFDGLYDWPVGDLVAKDLIVSSNAFSLRAMGTSAGDETDLDIQWRVMLDRLQGSIGQPVAAAGSGSPFRQVGFRSNSAAQPDQWSLLGQCEGSVVIKRHQRLLDMNIDATARNLQLLQPLNQTPQYRLVGPTPGSQPLGATGTTGGANATGTPGIGAAAQVPGSVVWSEPNLKVGGLVRYDPQSSALTSDAMQVAGDWFATTLKGGWQRQSDGDNLLLEGPARLKMNEVAARLSSLLGMSIFAEGVHETPLLIRVNRSQRAGTEFSVRGNLGWEAADVAGVQLGPASVPVRVNETTLEIPPSRIPVGQGAVNLAGQVHYRPGPMWIQLERGVVAESIRLTPEMTHRWLKYLAPLAANATQIDGVLGAELDEAVIVIDRPEESRVLGRLNIGNVQLNAGPLANQLIFGINQLKSLGGVLQPPATTEVGKTLMRMPAQTVDFAVNHGVVSHERLFFEIDRAQVVTSGRVSLDGRLNMIAMVPLDERWLGSDLKGLAGQTVTLPIDGTLSRPSLDSRGVAQVITQLGTQAVQSQAENYLQQQLNRGLERLFGR